MFDNNDDHNDTDTVVIGAGQAGLAMSVHTRGVGALPGLYFLGLRWQHRRSSRTLDGVGRDAEFLAEQVATRLTQAEFRRDPADRKDIVAA